MNGQSAAKSLSTEVYEEGSTTISVKESTGENSLGNSGNYYIYILIDPRNNKIRYVGKTLDLNRRFIKHLSEAKTSRYNTAKDNWIRKLLSLNLKPTIVEIDRCNTKKESSDLEIYYIQKYKKDCIELYNSTEGGDYTTDSKLKKPILRYSITGSFIEEFESISDAVRKLDLKQSLLSGAVNGRHKYYFNSIWKFKTNETYSKNIDGVSYKGSKKVGQYDKDLNLVKVWNNQLLAANYYKIDRSSIGNCCLGKSKTSMGFIWKYLN